MKVGYCEVPIDIVYQDIEFMNIEGDVREIKKQIADGEAERKKSNQ